MLRHTAEQAQLHLGTCMLEAGEIAEAAKHAFFGVLTNRARIQQDYVGQLGPRRRRVARVLEHRAHELRVRDIHLAAVRLDIYARLRRMVCSFGHRNELDLRLQAVRDTTSLSGESSESVTLAKLPLHNYPTGPFFTLLPFPLGKGRGLGRMGSSTQTRWGTGIF